MNVLGTPCDPLIARDSRPFGRGQGNRARTLDWFYPSVVTGSLRSLLGKLEGGFSPQVVEALKKIRVRGPFPAFDDTLYLPCPRDLLVREEEGTRSIFPLRPPCGGDGPEQGSSASGGGTNLPEGIVPTFLVGPEEGDDFKPAPLPPFWSVEKTVQWLVAEKDWIAEAEKRGTRGKGFLAAFGRDTRTHVSIDPRMGTAAEGMLFSTTGLDFVRREEPPGSPRFAQGSFALEAEPCAEGSTNADVAKRLGSLKKHLGCLDHLHPLGGERRLVHWQQGKLAPSLWDCPEQVRHALDEKGGRVRLQLATPALFSGGWLPGWLSERDDKGCFVGSPPGLDRPVRLRLVSAVVGRWIPLSGWNLEKGKPYGPKPLRRMVPAGSVYFFESADEHQRLAPLAGRWLHSVCDEEQDRLDGFGLALWGVWNPVKRG